MLKRAVDAVSLVSAGNRERVTVGPGAAANGRGDVQEEREVATARKAAEGAKAREKVKDSREPASSLAWGPRQALFSCNCRPLLGKVLLKNWGVLFSNLKTLSTVHASQYPL